MTDSDDAETPARSGGDGAARYWPGAFSRPRLEDARRIILTGEEGATTEERWATETPWFAAEIAQTLSPGPQDVVVDFGCGVGRLAKPLIEATGCVVIGVDISAEMRAHAVDHVASDRFAAITPGVFAAMVAQGVRIDAAFSVWALQHCLDAIDVVETIRAALSPGGRFYIANSRMRLIPTDRGWRDDGLDLAALLDARFRFLEDRPVPEGVAVETVRNHAFYRLYERPP